MLVVEEDVTLKRECQIFTRLETMRGQHIRDSAIEPFNHAVGLWVLGLGQAMFDVEGCAKLIKFMFAAGLLLLVE